MYLCTTQSQRVSLCSWSTRTLTVAHAKPRAHTQSCRPCWCVGTNGFLRLILQWVLMYGVWSYWKPPLHDLLVALAISLFMYSSFFCRICVSAALAHTGRRTEIWDVDYIKLSSMAWSLTESNWLTQDLNTKWSEKCLHLQRTHDSQRTQQDS